MGICVSTNNSHRKSKSALSSNIRKAPTNNINRGATLYGHRDGGGITDREYIVNII